MSKTLEELTAERDKFLEEHPHLKPLQAELDKAMKDMTPIERLNYLFLQMI